MVSENSGFMAHYTSGEGVAHGVMNDWLVQAEYGVLAVLLMNNEEFDQVGTFLLPEHFSTTIGRKVYASISKFVAQGQRCDAITVYEDLSRTDPGNDVSIMELNDIAQHGGAVSLLTTYARSIYEKHKERELLTMLSKAHIEAANESSPIGDRLARIGSMFDALVQQSVAGKAPVQMGSLIPAYLDKLQRYADGDEVSAISTGVSKLDEYLNGGWRSGKVYVIAARPSVGKSAIAQASVETCARLGKAAAIFSQEMTNEEMVDRAISRIGGVHMGFHNKPIGDNEQFTYALEAASIATDMPLFLFDQAGLRLTDIATHARALKRKHNLQLLAIDYLQLCQSANPRLSRHHQIEEISRGIKVLAKELNIPILLLSQLNREVEKRTPPRPIMSDLKESGAIEEDADAIIGMWPHEVGDSSTLVGFDVMKNRGGSKGSFGVRFVGKYQQWHETDEPLKEPQKAKAGSYGF